MIKEKSVDVYGSERIVAYDDAVRLISDIKSKNKTAGLCHGGFDLLHPGHVKHFESAKKLCDFLAVSITSDRFVSSRKGSGRPIFSDKIRAYMVASIGCVDCVVISDFKRGIDVVNLLKPSFYIKGPDFIKKTTPGITAEREAIKNVGGEMKYTNDPKLSTTEIIDYVKNKIDNRNFLIVIDRDGTIIKNDDFFGKNENWADEIEFKEDVISFLSYLQTKYKTTKVVITNQAGVARCLFDCKRVKEINKYINNELTKRGVKIDNWQYCPDVDTKYAKLKKDEINFDKNFIKEHTRRKPNTDMVSDGLKELKKDTGEFDEILVIGDRDEDKGLAENLKGKFIDVNDKGYGELLSEIKDT